MASSVASALERTKNVALVAFLRGVNVGGHRRFRPSLLAAELAGYDVVNVGATGLLIVRKATSQAAFRTELLRRLPFDAEVALCSGRDLLELQRADPFGSLPPRKDVVRFVSVLVGATPRRAPRMPLQIPRAGRWYVRIIGRHKRFVFGVYRRHMKTIGYLGQLDKLLEARVTTRNWNTILAVISILERGGVGANSLETP
jgi:uncharacterized protein (DUF1697 family)